MIQNDFHHYSLVVTLYVIHVQLIHCFCQSLSCISVDPNAEKEKQKKNIRSKNLFGVSFFKILFVVIFNGVNKLNGGSIFLNSVFIVFEGKFVNRKFVDYLLKIIVDIGCGPNKVVFF